MTLYNTLRHEKGRMWANMDNHLGLPDGIYMQFIIAFDCKRMHVMNNPAYFYVLRQKNSLQQLLLLLLFKAEVISVRAVNLTTLFLGRLRPP